MTPAARLSALQGRWTVLRAIRHADGTRARFLGDAIWDGARCLEAGTLWAGGGAMGARRETVWTADGDALRVAFADGRPFHAVGPDAQHGCPPDDYRLAYDFRAWPLWSCRWRVQGPRKDYVALTRYRPARRAVAASRRAAISPSRTDQTSGL